MIVFKAKSASRQADLKADFIVDKKVIFTAINFKVGFLINLVVNAAFTTCNWLLQCRSKYNSSLKDYTI